MDPFLLIGIVGMVLILGAFIAGEAHLLSTDDLLYDVCNFLGSALLVINAWGTHAWPFLILNTVWAAYSLKDIVFDDSKKIKKLLRLKSA